VLENKLDTALTKFNDLQSQNKGLRGEIDVWRKQLRNQTRVNKGYTTEITQTIQKIKELNNHTSNTQSFSESQVN
jgi:peptidoglycan hydrolase CwlO-like protein